MATPSCLALAFGTNYRVHRCHFSLAPFRWANPRQCCSWDRRWNELFMYLFSYTCKFIYTVKYIHYLVYTYISHSLNLVIKYIHVIRKCKIEKHETTPNTNICWSPIFTSKVHPGCIQQENHVSVEVLCRRCSCARRANLEVTDRPKRSCSIISTRDSWILHVKDICIICKGSVEIFEEQLWNGRMQLSKNMVAVSFKS